MLTIHGNSRIHSPTEDNAPLLKIQHGEEDIALGGFSLDTTNSVFSVRVDDDFVISNVALNMMKKMSYMLGLGLGKNLQGPPKFNITGTTVRKTGLGYKPSKDEVVKEGDRLEDYFVKKPNKSIKVNRSHSGTKKPKLIYRGLRHSPTMFGQKLKKRSRLWQ